MSGLCMKTDTFSIMKDGNMTLICSTEPTQSMFNLSHSQDDISMLTVSFPCAEFEYTVGQQRDRKEGEEVKE